MPITYQPPAPVGILSGIARNQQPQGVPLSEMYAAEMQAKQAAAGQQAALMSQDRQFNDHLRTQRDMFQQSQQFSGRDQGMAESQMALQQQRVALQVQANQAELTQAENLRLQRLKQGEDTVKQQMSDGTISRAEGAQQLAQLRTPIQVYEARKAESQIKAHDMQAQALQQQIETQRSIEIRKQKDDEARLQFSAATAEGKLKHIVNPGMASELTAKYQRDYPDMPPEAIKQAVEEELMAGGHYSTWYPNEKGVLQQAKEPTHGGAGASSGGEGGSPGRGGKGGIPEFDPSHAYSDAEKAVDALVRDGAIKPEEAQAKVMERYNARKAAHAGLVSERATAAQAGKPAPFNPDTGEGASDQQKGKIVQLKDQFRAIHEAAGRFTPAQQFMMSKAINESIRLYARNSKPDGSMGELKPIDRKRLEQLNAILAPLASPGGGQAPPSGPMTLEQQQALAAQLQQHGLAAAAQNAAAQRASAEQAARNGIRPASQMLNRMIGRPPLSRGY